MHRFMEDKSLSLTRALVTTPGASSVICLYPETLSEGNLGDGIYRRGVEQKHHCLSANVARVATGTDLRAYE